MGPPPTGIRDSASVAGWFWHPSEAPGALITQGGHLCQRDALSLCCCLPPWVPLVAVGVLQWGFPMGIAFPRGSQPDLAPLPAVPLWWFPTLALGCCAVERGLLVKSLASGPSWSWGRGCSIPCHQLCTSRIWDSATFVATSHSPIMPSRTRPGFWGPSENAYPGVLPPHHPVPPKSPKR